MKILLMRHLHPETLENSGVTFDAERPLSEEGKCHAEKISDFLKFTGLSPVKAICSPFKRSSETAEIIMKSFCLEDKVFCTTSIVPGSDLDDLLSVVSNNCDGDDQWMLAVLHEPDVSYILRKLFQSDSFPQAVRSGALFALDIDFVNQVPQASLVASYSPMTAELCQSC